MHRAFAVHRVSAKIYVMKFYCFSCCLTSFGDRMLSVYTGAMVVIQISCSLVSSMGMDSKGPAVPNLQRTRSVSWDSLPRCISSIQSLVVTVW